MVRIMSESIFVFELDRYRFVEAWIEYDSELWPHDCPLAVFCGMAA